MFLEKNNIFSIYTNRFHILVLYYSVYLEHTAKKSKESHNGQKIFTTNSYIDWF
jgi:hypothetical protein